jgi:short-subunit dehydrogenase
VHPGGVKTNLVRNARFRTGKDPVQAKQQSIQFFNRYMAWTSPERAAKVILAGIRKKKKRILIGPDAHLYAIFLRLCPNIWHSLMTHV